MHLKHWFICISSAMLHKLSCCMVAIVTAQLWHLVASPSGWAGCHDHLPVAEERERKEMPRSVETLLNTLQGYLHVPYWAHILIASFIWIYSPVLVWHSTKVYSRDMLINVSCQENILLPRGCSFIVWDTYSYLCVHIQTEIGYTILWCTMS